MIIQSIALLDTLDKDVNTFIMRVREWRAPLRPPPPTRATPQASAGEASDG